MQLKKSILPLFGLLFLSTIAFAQQNYKTEKDQSGHKMLTGELNMPLLSNDSAFSWFYAGVNQYKPHKEWVNYIRYYRDSFSLVVFAGTWDSRSQQLLPQLYRTLLAASYPVNKIRLFGVDEQLQGIKEETAKYQIKKIPTIIISDNSGQELGRIEESPVNSIEANIVAILQTKFRPDGN